VTVDTNGRKDIGALMREGTAVDRAVKLAFHDAVRRHRQANVPVVMRENGQVVLVSPFDVPLPEDEPGGNGNGAHP
jgi:hypothetical protein